MKIFIWNEMETLARYARGRVIVHAPDLEIARIFAVTAFTAERHAIYGLPEFYAEDVTAFKAELDSKTPTETDGLSVHLIWGSE